MFSSWQPITTLGLAGLVVACLSSLLTASIASTRGWTAPAMLAALPAILAVLAAGAGLLMKKQKRRRAWGGRYVPDAPGEPETVTSGPFGAYRSSWSA